MTDDTALIDAEAVEHTGPPLTIATRPNGRLYRARKRPEAIETYDVHEETALAVIRTDDLALAARMVRRQFGAEVKPEDGRVVWWRLGYDYGEAKYLQDEERGMPCVLFEDVEL